MKNVLTILVLFLVTASFGQEQGNIKGQLQSNQESIEYATLVLRAAVDSAIVKTELSGLDGEFEFFNLSYGDYFLEVMHLGYTNHNSPVFTLNTPEYTMPSVMMESATNVLETAVVTSKKPFITREIDRTVVNVEGSLLAAGGSAIDVLNTSPGITVSRSGAISLAGKSGVLVFIDGKKAYLSGSDLTSYLDNLSAEELSQIEIMSTPPASYDAAGNAGVINIKTKKSRLKGYSGSVGMSYRQGKHPILRQNTNFNYRSKAFSLFANLSLNSIKDFDNLYIVRNLRELGSSDIETIYNQNTNQINNSKNLNARLGMDYYLSDRTTLGMSGNFYTNKGDVEISNTTLLKDPSNTVLQSILAPGTTDTEWDNYNFNLNLQHQFDSTDHSLFVDVDYLSYKTFSEQSIENSFFDGIIEGNEAPISRSGILNRFPQNIDIYSGKVDYIRPAFSGRGTLEFGFKSSYVKSDNIFNFFNVDENSNLTLDSAQSNHFIYKEKINAGYANAKLKINEQWGAQLGLRVEATDGEGTQVLTNRTTFNDYVELFPSAYVTYNINEANVLGLSYGRRIERPAYSDLNPFRVYLDQFTFEEGNPWLAPQTSHNLELNYMGAFRATAYYNDIDNVIMSTVSQNIEKNETFIRPENLANSKVYGVYLDANFEPASFITTNIFLNVYNASTEGEVNDLPFSIEGTTFSGKIINGVSFGDGWRFSMGAWYTSKSLESTFRRNPFGRLGFAIQKSFLDRNATLRVSSNDPFRWDKFVGSSNFQNIDLYGENNWQTRTILVSFTYKFRNGKVKRRSERESGISEETDRVRIQE